MVADEARFRCWRCESGDLLIAKTYCTELLLDEDGSLCECEYGREAVMERRPVSVNYAVQCNSCGRIQDRLEVCSHPMGIIKIRDRAEEPDQEQTQIIEQAQREARINECDEIKRRLRIDQGRGFGFEVALGIVETRQGQLIREREEE